MKTQQGYEICDDCLIWLANGDATSEHQERIRIYSRGLELIPACDEHCEGYISSTRCDLCQDTLQGVRHPAAIIIRGDAQAR